MKTLVVAQKRLMGPISIVAAVPPQGTTPTDRSAGLYDPVPIMKVKCKPVGKGKLPGAEIVPSVALATVLPMEVTATELKP